ncbi:MAG: glycosyltransferase [Bacteroidia bacterium]|nr:glycosyltransferase [Bacteroidia bacterium]
MFFSFVIPVYNRPDEVSELLDSLAKVTLKEPFEVVIVEDGSTVDCRAVVDRFREKLRVSYYFKPNTGPGDSRNYGMRKAQGDYFLLVDSDCIVPPHYLTTVAQALEHQYVDCFGGPDGALADFSPVQKAINFAMTSPLTTGGVRGGGERAGKFQPRSFNMGISRKAFEASGGFTDIHPGEDPDLSIRLWKAGFDTRLIKGAYVFHKRRISWSKFYIQVNKFGKVRPILDRWHPRYAKITYWFPSLFMLGLLVSLVVALAGVPYLLLLYATYCFALLVSAIRETRSIKLASLAVVAALIQFAGYGAGFLLSFLQVRLLRKDPRKVFPELFFGRR